MLYAENRSATGTNGIDAVWYKAVPSAYAAWLVPEVALVHEVRGDDRQAADCYRKVIEFIRQHPDNYDAAIVEQFAKLVERLDPPVAT